MKIKIESEIGYAIDRNILIVILLANEGSQFPIAPMKNTIVNNYKL